MPTEQNVLDALRVIVDPDLHKDIVTLGFVKNLRIEGGKVSFALELTTPACPMKQRFQSQAETTVRALPGVTEVNVTMTAQARQPHTQEPIASLEHVGAVVAVSSCKGGVGKSTVAAYLARALQREGKAVALLDLDVFGPSLPTLMKLHAPEVYMIGEAIQPIVVDGLPTMSLGYLFGDRPAVMRGPMVSNYVAQILRQTEWGELDYLVIDLPPGTGDIQLTLVQQVALDGALIVTTPQALSLVDVSRGILMFEKVQVPVLGIVENMAYFECDNCGKNHFIFGDNADTLKERFGLDTLARLPLIPGLCDASERGAGANLDAFAGLADNIHRAIGKRRAESGAAPEATAEPGYICISWPDGTSSRIENRAVRLSCKCAHCVDEFTGKPLLDPTTVPDDIEAVEIAPLGHYAVSIAWSDGHASGIFSWNHLEKVAGNCGGGCADCKKCIHEN